MLILEVIIGLFVLVLLVVVHEFGHAIVAHKNGVVVEEFGIGLPPAAKKKTLKNGFIFSLNWLPVGGFVKLKGEYDAASEKGDYGAATFWKKTKILFAGVVFNWLFAAILLSILALFGLPKIMDNQFSIEGDRTTILQPVQIVSLIKDGAAEKAGLLADDKIIKFDGQSVSTVGQLVALSKKSQDKSVEITYSRKGSEASIILNLGNENNGGHIIGAGLGQNESIKSTWSAPIVGVATTAQFTWLTVQSLGNLVVNIFTSGIKSVGNSVAGPVGILGSIFPSAIQGGLTQLVLLTAIVSISLAVMNILPIPALDGGRWLTMTLFKLFKKNLTKEREEKIQAIGFYVLMALIILVTINDIAKFF
jgi:regulator of sigma E protease